MAGINQAYFTGSNEWAIILGGSSGIGLATAQKLAQEGMHLFILHRDRRGDMEKVSKSFDEMREKGVQVVSLNKDATQPATIETAFDSMTEHLGSEGKIKVLLHALSRGNLKPFVEVKPKIGPIGKSSYSEIECKEEAVRSSIKGSLTD